MNNVIQIKDLLTILATSITIIVAIYYALNFFLNMDKEEKVMNIYGYNRKSINVPLIIFIIIYSMYPILGTFYIKCNFKYLEIFSLFTIVINLIYINSYLYLRLKKQSSTFRIVSCILSVIIYLCFYSYFYLNININNKIFISKSLDFNLFIISNIIVLFIARYLIKQNKFFDELVMYFTENPFFGSYILFCIIFAFLHLISIGVLVEEFKYLLTPLYISIGLLIFISSFSKYKKISIQQTEIIFKKDIFDLNENKLGVIISETNDDIVFEIDGILHRYGKSDIFCIKEYQNPYINILNNMNKSIKTIELYIECITKIKISNSNIDNIIKYDKKIKTHLDILETQLFNLIEVQNNNYISSYEIAPKINDILQNITNINSIQLIKKIKNNDMFEKILNHYLEKMKTNCTEIKNQISDLKQKLEEQEKKKLEDKNQETPS